MKGRALRMRSILISVIWFLFPLVMIGCSGLGISQQPRLEISESANLFVIRPQGLFFAPMALTLSERGDGVVAVHPAGGATPAHLLSDSVSDSGLAQLDESLLPFLFPSCAVSFQPVRGSR